MTAEVADTGHGRRLIQASWIGTAVFALTAIAATAVPTTLDVPALLVALFLFFAGVVIFFWAYGVAVARSREDEIAVNSLFLLSGSTPPVVRHHLLGSLATQIAVALVTAGIRPFTSLAFGVLTPVFGLGLAGLWAAKYGSFPRSQPSPGRRRRS
jgi:hypothetical protein